MVRGRRTPPPSAPPITLRAPADASARLEQNREDLLVLKELIEAGKVTLGSTDPLSEVPDVIRQLGEGHGRGKIVISV